MGDLQEVELRLRPEKWSDALALELRPLLERVTPQKSASRWLAGIVGALERGDAVACVARVAGAPALGVAVLAFQKWPLAAVHVLAMAAVPGSGFSWGPAFLPRLAAIARAAGAETIQAEALDPANRRRLEGLGFFRRSSLMVLPC